jgi:hypothetical protein
MGTSGGAQIIHFRATKAHLRGFAANCGRMPGKSKVIHSETRSQVKAQDSWR